MKILVTGRGGAASWTIRGEQLGQAMGATVKAGASLADMRAHDVIVAVKRVTPQMVLDLRRCGRPWAYDIVDAYPQRDACEWSGPQSVKWLRQYIAGLAPNMVVWPNARMREDVGRGGPVVYHHHRPGIVANPVRQQLRVVGYEGHDRYLDGVRDLLEAVCNRRGMRLVVNPPHLADVDVVLAVRGPAWRSYAADHWKSNVKLANAHASGTPFIGAPEMGYIETGTGREYWARTPADVAQALDWLEPWQTRVDIAHTFQKAAIPVEACAQQMREALCALKS